MDAFVVRGDGTAFARIHDEADAATWAVSEDGGRSWRATADAPTEAASSAQDGCAPRIGCFRIGDDRVEQAATADGPWRTSFAFTDEQRKRMDQRTTTDCGVTQGLFGALAVVDRPDGPHVVVAMGRQGVLHRTPTGRWERRAVLDREPMSLRGPTQLGRLVLVPLGLVVLAPIVLVVGIRRRSKRRAVAGAAVGMGGALALLILGGLLLLYGVDYTLTGPLVASLSILVFVASIVVTMGRGHRPRTRHPG